MEDKKQRKIAIFADTHALLEPLEAALADIERRGITEIYSLGDNITIGPNPHEVMNLLEEKGVISIAGNSEEYVRLGIEPFRLYFNTLKGRSQTWTLSKLNEHQKGLISLFPRSIELLIGGKKLALCHFANDVRFDFIKKNVWTYQEAVRKNFPNPHQQFMYTNSKEQQDEIAQMIQKFGQDSPFIRGYLSAKDDPLFRGKRVDFFDAIIQGHIHFKIYEPNDTTSFYSIRALGLGYRDDPIDTASYVILTEKESAYDLEEVLVKFDREKMEYSILNSDIPDDTVYRFTEIKRR